MLVKIVCSECEKGNHKQCHDIRIDQFKHQKFFSTKIDCPCRVKNHEGFGLLKIEEEKK